MAGEDVLDHVVVESVNFNGNVWSERLTTEWQTKRFRGISFKLANFTVRNSGAANAALIGKYTSGEIAFEASAYTLNPGYSLRLEQVDLYILGYYQVVAGTTTLEVIGTY